LVEKTLDELKENERKSIQEVKVAQQKMLQTNKRKLNEALTDLISIQNSKEEIEDENQRLQERMK
jgi:hypothetical protein